MEYKLNTEDLNQFNYIIDTDYKYHIENSENVEELREALEEDINAFEVIYYNRAIEFLKEEDQSLQESIEIAQEFGYEIGQVTSELLATLLLQARMNDELEDFVSLVEEKEND